MKKKIFTTACLVLALFILPYWFAGYYARNKLEQSILGKSFHLNIKPGLFKSYVSFDTTMFGQHFEYSGTLRHGPILFNGYDLKPGLFQLDGNFKWHQHEMKTKLFSLDFYAPYQGASVFHLKSSSSLNRLLHTQQGDWQGITADMESSHMKLIIHPFEHPLLSLGMTNIDWSPITDVDKSYRISGRISSIKHPALTLDVNDVIFEQKFNHVPVQFLSNSIKPFIQVIQNFQFNHNKQLMIDDALKRAILTRTNAVLQYWHEAFNEGLRIESVLQSKHDNQLFHFVFDAKNLASEHLRVLLAQQFSDTVGKVNASLSYDSKENNIKVALHGNDTAGLSLIFPYVRLALSANLRMQDMASLTDAEYSRLRVLALMSYTDQALRFYVNQMASMMADKAWILNQKNYLQTVFDYDIASGQILINNREAMSLSELQQAVLLMQRRVLDDVLATKAQAELLSFNH